MPQKDYETHCKSKEHYDKFVDIVNGKKHKALQMESKISKEKEQENTATKRKSELMLFTKDCFPKICNRAIPSLSFFASIFGQNDIFQLFKKGWQSKKLCLLYYIIF